VSDGRFGDRERERLFSLLSAHAAADHIDLEELERRVVAVSEAQGAEQAEAVLADLPALPPGMRPQATTGFGDGPAQPGAEAGRPRWGKGHGDAERPADGWQATDERFRDPRTRQVMRVWEDTAGGRHYVPDDQRPG
jgi:hypothetical protein